MPIKKLPAYQWYPGDWRKDPGVQTLNYHDRGVWLEILDFMHESEVRGELVINGRAMTDQEVADMLRLPLAKLKQTLSKLLSKNVANKCACHGAICNRRMVRDEHLRQVRAVAGGKGGKQKAQNQSSKRLAKATPSVSVSSSVSSSVTDKTDKQPGVAPETPPKLATAKTAPGNDGKNGAEYLASLYVSAGGLQERGKAVAFFAAMTRRIKPERFAEILQSPEGQGRYLHEIKNLIDTQVQPKKESSREMLDRIVKSTSEKMRPPYAT